MNVAVRFVVRRLCVPVLATTVELATVGLPNGNQPCVVPSSKSSWIGPVKAAAVLRTFSWLRGGSEPVVQPNAMVIHKNIAMRNTVPVLISGLPQGA
jgi:hypothetical protein